MCDLEEPPAKVLKIDNIDGVTRVTELDQMPPMDESMEDHEILGEMSGIIEGEADGADHEGHEEWLSEGILTDDDFNPGSQQDPGEDDHTDSQLGSSQEEDHLDSTLDSEMSLADVVPNTTVIDNSTANGQDTVKSTAKYKSNRSKTTEMNDSLLESQTYTQSPFGIESETNTMESGTNIAESVDNIINSGILNTTDIEAKTMGLNIEETMKHLDGNKDDDAKSDLFDSLLDKKEDRKVEPKNIKPVAKEEQDDGNDTDDLLRMLGGEDNKTKKKLTKTVKDIRAAAAAAAEDASSDDDDDFVYKGAASKKLQVAKNALAKKQTPMKAEPEEMDDGDDETDASGDDKKCMKSMFNTPKPTKVTRKTSQPSSVTSSPMRVTRGSVLRNIVQVVDKPNNIQVKTEPTPVKQYQNRRAQSKQQTTPKESPKPQALLTESPKPQVVTKQAAKTQVTPKQAAKTQVTPKQAAKTQVAPKQAAKAQVVPKQAAKAQVVPKQAAKTQVVPKPSPKTQIVPKQSPKTQIVPKQSPMAQAVVKKIPTPQSVLKKPATTVQCVTKQPPTPALTSRLVAITKVGNTKTVADIKNKAATNGSFNPPEVTTPSPFKPSTTFKGLERKKTAGRVKFNSKVEHDEIIDEDEFLDEDEFDLDEDEFGESDQDNKSRSRQRIMRPEMMDEEIPSDGESQSEDGSLYDELPSSDSEDMDDWFTLDIRAEKAGDYIPLLGSRAKELLLEEKTRVTARLQTLKKSLSALTDSGKKQAEQLREATISLAELDDMLKAS